jgi:hypothetical protein
MNSVISDTVCTLHVNSFSYVPQVVLLIHSK